GLGFSKQVKDNELYDEALMSAFDSHSSDIEDAPVYDRFGKVKGMHAGNFMPPTPDLSFIGLDEFVNKPVVENCKAMSSKEEPKVVRKSDDALIIEDWVSDDEEDDMS
ncbi:hypothetical protein Tco_1223723, partial [Tanacetum coccineum]